MVSMSRKLTQELAKIQFAQLPTDVVTYSKYLFLDLIGVALAAGETPEAKGMLESLSSSGSLRAEGSTLWGTTYNASAPDAALFNGTLAHALELDDFGGADHSGSVVFPALMAALNADTPISGQHFIEALIIGYDVCYRLLEASGSYRKHNADGGWHSTATCGAAGAAAAAARILNLNEDQTVNALGFAASMTGGTWAFNQDGAMSKRIHPGWAAHLGVNAAFFAQSGLTGPEYCFEAEWGGFFHTYARGHAIPERLLNDFGGDFKIRNSGVKPYPCCRDNHSVIDIMLDVREALSGKIEEIDYVEIYCIPEIYKMLSNSMPRNTMEAQLSLAHCAAVALRHGVPHLDHFSVKNLRDPKVVPLKDKIKLIESSSLKPGSEPEVRIYYQNGQIDTRHVPYAKGAPENPLSPEEILTKFNTMCFNHVSNERQETLIKTIMSLENMNDVNQISAFLSE